MGYSRTDDGGQRTDDRAPPSVLGLPSSVVRSGRLGGELAALLDRLLDGADHVERRLRQMVVLAFAQALEALDRVGEIDEHAGRAGEHLGDVERLRQEALDL